MLIIRWWKFQPRAEDTQTLDSGLIFSTIYDCPIDGFWSPLPPPPKIPPPVLYVFKHFSRACIPLSPPLASSPSVFRLFGRLLSSAVCHPPSARNCLAAGAMLLLLSFPVNRWLCACSPLDLCGWQYLARVLVEGLKETAPSALSGVSRLVARRRPVIVARVLCLPGVSGVLCRPLTPKFPLDSCGARGRRRPPHWSWVPRLVTSRIPGIVPADERSIALSISAVPVSRLPPPSPPPFLVQPYLSRYPPDQRESIFVVVPLALSPLVPPGLGPFALLTAVVVPFHFHPPR